jgi:hypothetical protein
MGTLPASEQTPDSGVLSPKHFPTLQAQSVFPLTLNSPQVCDSPFLPTVAPFTLCAFPGLSEFCSSVSLGPREGLEKCGGSEALSLPLSQRQPTADLGHPRPLQLGTAQTSHRKEPRGLSRVLRVCPGLSHGHPSRLGGKKAGGARWG